MVDVLRLSVGAACWVTITFFTDEPALMVSVAWRFDAPVYAEIVTSILEVEFLSPPEGKILHQSASDEMLQSALALTDRLADEASHGASIFSGVTLIVTPESPPFGSSVLSPEHEQAAAAMVVMAIDRKRDLNSFIILLLVLEV